MYLVFWPGTYLAIWSRILASSSSGAGTQIIFFGGLVKALLYLSELLVRKTNFKLSQAIGKATFAIQEGASILVLLLLISALSIRVPTPEFAFKACFAWLAVDLILFPLIAVLHLQDTIRHQESGFATVLLLSFALYVCMAFITASDVVEVKSAFANIPGSTPLEAAGLRMFLLLISISTFIGTHFFWRSASLYSFDIAPPPLWVGGICVLTLTLFLYFHGRRFPVAESQHGPADLESFTPVSMMRTAITILTASGLAFLLAFGADLAIPHNVAGKALQVLVFLVALLVTFIITKREA